MRGRELQFKEQAEEMMERFKQDMGEEVAVEQPAKLQGRSMVMLLGPKKK